MLVPKPSTLSFRNYAFGVVSKIFLFNPKSQKFIAIFSSRSFIVANFTFKLVIHFQLIVVYCLRYVLTFFFAYK